MRTAVKCPIYPTPAQKIMLTRQFGAVRFVWNHMLALRLRHHRIFGRWASPLTLKNRLSVMKKRARWAWLAEADSMALQEALRDMQRALTNFFEHGAGLPKFKRKAGKQTSAHFTSLRLTASPSENLRGNAEIRVPKVGAIRMNLHRQLPAAWRLTKVTLSRSAAGRYYASLAFEDGRAAPAPPAVIRADEIRGGDLGLNTLLTLDDGTEIANPRHEREHARAIRAAHKSLSRKQKGSKNWEKACAKLARAYEKRANAVNDTAHKISRRLVDENQAIGLESLSVKGMMRSGRGLAKSLAGAAFGKIVQFTAYKAKRAGKVFHQVGRFFPSSKTCRPCGHVHRGLGRGEQRWLCPCCGALLMRDRNAAENVRDETIRELRAVGLTVLGP